MRGNLVARTLLVSKLVPPPLPHRVVVRERVHDRLAAAAEARFTLVAAPPGAGKTVAVREWIEDLPGAAVAWLSLDEDDDDPVVFWSYVVGALRVADPEVGRESVALLDEGGADEPHFLVALLNDLAGSRRHPILLVLDDLHWIRDRRVLDQFETFVERLPAGDRVVATSRADPALPLARWRARGELLEVRGEVLQFRPDEVSAFLERFGNLDLDDAAVALLTARTEGWAVGLQLAALSMQDRDDADEYLERFTGDNRIVADFLVAEVVDHQPPEITEFLLETSVLRRLTSRHCDAVTGRLDSARLLRELEARYLFVTEIESDARVYRYHDLFAELLRHLLKVRRPGAFEELNRRAAETYELEGDLVDAVHHWVRAGEHDHAFKLVTDAIIVTPSHYSATVEGRSEWLELIPADYIAADAARMIDCAYALTFMARYADAEQWLRRAEQRIVDTKQAVWARLLLARGVWLGTQGDVEAGTADASAALDLFRVLEGPRSQDPYSIRAPPMLARGHYMLGRPDLAMDSLRELSSRPDLPPFVTSLILPAIEAMCAIVQGDLAHADALSTRARSAAEYMSIPLNYAACEARLVQIGLRFERGQLTQADAELESFLDDVGVEHYLPLQVMAWILGARIFAARTGLDDALASLAVARRFVATHGRGDRFGVMLDRAEARLLAEAGHTERARALITRLGPDADRALLEARLDVATGRTAAARSRLTRIEATSRRQRIELELLRARAEVAMREDLALEHVRNAVELGRADGYLQIYLEAGPEIARLLRVLAHREPSYFLDAVLAASGGAYPVDTSTVLVEPLTDRERSVLGLLGGTLTNREIAAELYMSLNTLKTHLKSIYRKLQVTSRRDAVGAARRLGIL